MIVLISAPEKQLHEVELLQTCMFDFPDWNIHLRKPLWNETQLQDFLEQFTVAERSRIVLHSHFSLAESYGLKGIHLPEQIRRENTENRPQISTSFHSLAEARAYEKQLSYFFCSPVFASISKTDYLPTEDWKIKAETIDFRNKAVALGGISEVRISEVRNRGFFHIAVMGAVWKSRNPLKSMQKIAEAYSHAF